VWSSSQQRKRDRAENTRTQHLHEYFAGTVTALAAVAAPSSASTPHRTTSLLAVERCIVAAGV
jgi:hypothetical protein